MALNITFTGNIYSDLPINCNYQVYYVRQNKWSPILVSEFNQYNFNAGSNSHLTQDGELKINDVIIVTFFTENTRETAEQGLFSSIAIVHDLTTTYIQDVQLKGLKELTCNINSTDIQLVGNQLSLVPNESLDYEWMFAGKKHYQKRLLYAAEIFTNLKLSEILYDFGSGYTTNNTHVFNTTGSFTGTYKITLPNDTILECNKQYIIKNNQPTINYIIHNNITLGTNLIIDINIVDNDNTIITAQHLFDGEIKIESSNLLETYNTVLLENKIYEYRTELEWYDGFENKLLTYTGIIELENIAPIINLEVTQSENHLIFNPNTNDVDGFIDTVRYQIFVCKDSVFEEHIDINEEHNWVLLDTFYSDTNNFELELMFYKGGDYKVHAQAFDNNGLSSNINEEFFNISCNTNNNCQVVDLDWAKRVNNIKFNVKTTNYKFNIKSNQIKFKTQTNKVIFKQITKSILFNININKIKFKTQRI